MGGLDPPIQGNRQGILGPALDGRLGGRPQMLSRVADSLYWMSRYIERAEHTSRVMAVKLESMVEQTPEDASASWSRVVEALRGEKFDHQPQDAFAITKKIAFDRSSDSSLITSLTLARDNARQVREALSNEVWESL